MFSAPPRRPKLPFHPCVHEGAHHKIARLHLPVAPACNLHCIYCTRSIGPENPETMAAGGPGKASCLLSPEAALKKTADFIATWGRESVIGIAGPGDPLANPETFITLAAIRRRFPEARLCLCTNGLALPENLDTLLRLGLEHLSITINAVDPGITAKIQPWILDGKEKIRGEEGAGILLDRQLWGLKEAVYAGMFVKINTVVVPGINDEHIPEIAARVAALGAGILNPMPLIPNGATAHMAPPSAKKMAALHETCAPLLPTFRRCRQCRADAEGIPGKENISCRKTA